MCATTTGMWFADGRVNAPLSIWPLLRTLHEAWIEWRGLCSSVSWGSRMWAMPCQACNRTDLGSVWCTMVVTIVTRQVSRGVILRHRLCSKRPVQVMHTDQNCAVARRHNNPHVQDCHQAKAVHQELDERFTSIAEADAARQKPAPLTEDGPCRTSRSLRNLAELEP